MTFAQYFVCGRRSYRGHPPGTVFEARWDRGAEQRALARGDIRLVQQVTPSIQPGTFTFPDGWLSGMGPPSLPKQEGS